MMKNKGGVTAVRKFFTVIAIAVLLSVGTIGLASPLLAHEGADDLGDTTSTADTQIQDPAKVRERVEKRKNELKTRLDPAQTTRLKGRCKAAQANITKARTRSNEVEQRRLGHYHKVQDRVEELVKKYQEAGIIIDDITDAQTKIGVSVETLKTSFADYQQALDDTAAIDCNADPVGFKASLDASRRLHADLGKAYADLRKNIADNLLPALNAAKKELNSKGSESN